MTETQELEDHHNTEASDVTKMLDAEESSEDSLPTPKYRWYHINKEVLPGKMAYLFENGRRASAQIMLSMFYSSIGLNKGEVGLVMGFG